MTERKPEPQKSTSLKPASQKATSQKTPESKTPEELELEQENRIRRILIAIFTVLLLGAGVVLWFLGLSKEPGYIAYYSICWKVGPVLFMVWLAWDQLIKLPRWAYTTLPLVLIAALINKKLLLVVVPVAAVLAFLNHPWWKKLR